MNERNVLSFIEIKTSNKFTWRFFLLNFLRNDEGEINKLFSGNVNDCTSIFWQQKIMTLKDKLGCLVIRISPVQPSDNLQSQMCSIVWQLSQSCLLPLLPTKNNPIIHPFAMSKDKSHYYHLYVRGT